MTRIIAGFAGSLRLKVPSAGTRPTSDRVREAIFSSLDARDAIAGARVLDLYCGSGALGLEAASRGAATIALVDKAAAAARIARANAELVRRQATGRAPEIAVAERTVQSFLSDDDSTWDVVFLDPPYELPAAKAMADLAFLVPRLHPASVVVVERPAREPEPEWPAGLALERRKNYGETAVYWLGSA